MGCLTPSGAIAAQGNPSHPAHGLAVPGWYLLPFPGLLLILALGTEPIVTGFLKPAPPCKMFPKVTATG